MTTKVKLVLKSSRFAVNLKALNQTSKFFIFNHTSFGRKLYCSFLEKCEIYNIKNKLKNKISKNIVVFSSILEDIIAFKQLPTLQTNNAFNILTQVYNCL